MKVPRSTDRRVVQTRAALRRALLALIVERGWDALGIRDVCERAGVGRSTFYTHFADKEELLFSGFDELRSGLRASGRASGGARPLGFTRGLIEHAAENKQMFRALVGKRSSDLARRQMLRLVAELTREDLAPLAAGGKLDATAHLLAGALVELLVWWVDSRSPLSGDEIDALFHQLAAPLLPASGRSLRSR